MPTVLTAHELMQALRAEGLEPQSYSGRGMFGRECVAACVDHPGDHELPRGWVQDQLGLGCIVYWPQVAWPQKETN